MLASRKNPEMVVSLMNGDPFVIEKKFDGERIQIHKENDKIELFSRNLMNCTKIYGPKLKPAIMKAVTTDNCILDGELLVWDELLGRFEEFGKLKSYAIFDEGDVPSNSKEISENLMKHLCCLLFFNYFNRCML